MTGRRLLPPEGPRSNRRRWRRWGVSDPSPVPRFSVRPLAAGVAHAPVVSVIVSGRAGSRRVATWWPAQCWFVRKGTRCGTLSRTMIVLRCTQQLLHRLRHVDDGPAVTSTTRLGDWYGNTIRMGNRHVLLFISERSRLPVLIPIRQANKLRTVLPDAMSDMLAWMRVPEEAIAEECEQMSEVVFSRTNSRTLLGTMNDYAFMSDGAFAPKRDEPLGHVARFLAKTPIMPLKGECPLDLTRAAFGLERLSRLDL